ncbi:hypothetical protein Pmani_022138 [Petrolisthes manimaculis]|uniref:Uncharacterized protein n=1 Tax=Petrolisthes manimaculis TaxID=1843537 RepID=A0AAE1PEM3_9EUCA|nr:hypothetical protein Pmani_022138 [Petrolisthes manimaculis]
MDEAQTGTTHTGSETDYDSSNGRGRNNIIIQEGNGHEDGVRLMDVDSGLGDGQTADHNDGKRQEGGVGAVVQAVRKTGKNVGRKREEENGMRRR